MFVLIVCKKCNSFFIVQEGVKTCKCRRCGATSLFRTAKVSASSDCLEDLQKRICVCNATKACDDEFLNKFFPEKKP